MDAKAFKEKVAANRAAGVYDRKPEAGGEDMYDALGAEMEKHPVALGVTRRFGRAMKTAKD